MNILDCVRGTKKSYVTLESRLKVIYIYNIMLKKSGKANVPTVRIVLSLLSLVQLSIFRIEINHN